MAGPPAIHVFVGGREDGHGRYKHGHHDWLVAPAAHDEAEFVADGIFIMTAL